MGTSAHIFQLLIVAQVPLIVGFLASADLRRVRSVLLTTAVQLAALAIAFAPVFYFQL